MSLAVAIQMDPLETVDIEADSSFALALEAQTRGHGLYHYLPRQLSYRQGRIVATARPFRLRRERGKHVEFGSPETIDLATMDVVLMRQDPPFNLAYISATLPTARNRPAISSGEAWAVKSAIETYAPLGITRTCTGASGLIS